jgi:hypothetical protein
MILQARCLGEEGSEQLSMWRNSEQYTSSAKKHAVLRLATLFEPSQGQIRETFR